MNAHLQNKLSPANHGFQDRMVAPRDTETLPAKSTLPLTIPVLDEDFVETTSGYFAEPDWYEPYSGAEEIPMQLHNGAVRAMAVY
jgi:hypothetical protein